MVTSGHEMPLIGHESGHQSRGGLLLERGGFRVRVEGSGGSEDGRSASKGVRKFHEFALWQIPGHIHRNRLAGVERLITKQRIPYPVFYL